MEVVYKYLIMVFQFKNYVRITVLGGLLFVTTGLHAQVLSLRECLDQARTNYPSIKAMAAQLAGEEKRLLSSKIEYLPAFFAAGQINYGTNNSLNGAFYPNEGMSTGLSGGIRPENIYQGVFGSFTTLQIDWKAVSFGKIAANVKAAQSAVEVSKADYDNEVFQHLVRVADAYFLASVSERISQAQEKNLERAQKLYIATRAQVFSGLKAGTDSSFAAAEVSKARLLFFESQRNERAQHIRLAELMGIKGNTIRPDTSRFFSDLPRDFLMDEVNIQETPLVKLYHSQTAFRQAKATSIRRSYAPTIYFTGIGFARGSGVSNKDNAYRTDFSSGVGFQVYNYVAAISIRMNLLGFAKVKQDYRSELFEMQKSRYLEEEAELKSINQLSIADMQVALARQQATEAPVQLTAAQSAYSQANARYATGLATLPELAQSFYILNRAEIDKSIAINNAWRAILLKAAAAGNLSYLINQIN